MQLSKILEAVQYPLSAYQLEQIFQHLSKQQSAKRGVTITPAKIKSAWESLGRPTLSTPVGKMLIRFGMDKEQIAQLFRTLNIKDEIFQRSGLAGHLDKFQPANRAAVLQRLKRDAQASNV